MVQFAGCNGARCLVVILVTLHLPRLACPVHGQTFTDVTTQAGIDYLHYDQRAFNPLLPNELMTGGAAVGDVDGDGWVDLYVTRLDQPDILFRNLGSEAGVHRGFEDITATALPAAANVASNGAVLGDLDNDGDLDLYVTAMQDNRYYLYINDGSGVFTEEAISRGAAVDKPDVHFGYGIALGDYDRDGFLDVFTAEWRNRPCFSNPSLAPGNSRLLRNQGTRAPGHFEDVTQQAGVSMDLVPVTYHGRANAGASFAFAPRFSDVDGDGNPDLLVTSDFGTSRLFWNNGDGTFTDGTVSARVGTDRNGMGSTVGDFDGDGLLDWFVTAINTEEGNRLYRNEGNRTFSDHTAAAGVQYAGWGWGTSFFDYDNDGDQDIIMTNGFNIGPVPDDRSTLFRNEGGTFTDVSVSEGITDTDQGRGLLTFDYDMDGDLDVFIANNGGQPTLYRNNGNQNSFLRIVTEGTRSNRDGIGARITVVPDVNDSSRSMIREIDGGSNFLGHNELTAHFGLGPSAEPVDLVRIDWPSGIRQELHDVQANQIIRVVEPDRPLTDAEALRVSQSRSTAGKLARTLSADGVANIIRPLSPEDRMTVVYDPSNGQITFEGPDWHQYIEVDMEIVDRDGVPARFQFNTGVTDWPDRDVFSFEDEPKKQSFASYVECQGVFTMRGGQAIKELLPADLSESELNAHLSVQYVNKGVPGKHVANLVVIPEPSSASLLALGLLSLVIYNLRSVVTF